MLPSKFNALGSKTGFATDAITGSSSSQAQTSDERAANAIRPITDNQPTEGNFEMKMIAPALLLSIALLSACSKSAPTTEGPTTGGTTVAAAPKPAGETSGVPECDEYVNKIKACIKDKIPAAQQAMMEQSLNQTKASWASVSDKSTLAKSCQMMTDQAKASYKAMGCDF